MWDVVYRPVIVTEEDDVPKDVEQSEEHVESDEAHSGLCGSIGGAVQGLFGNRVDRGNLFAC